MRFRFRSKKNVLLRLILVLFILYVGYLLVSPFVKIKNKKDEIDRVNEQILIEKSKNEEILGKLEEKESEKNSEVQDGGSNSHSGSVRVYENVVR